MLDTIKASGHSTSALLGYRGDGNGDLGLATAIEQAGHAVVITDPGGNILYVNAAFTRMTGYSSEEAIGRNPRLLKSGKQNALYYKDLWGNITSGRNWHGELCNRRKDGSEYIEEMTIAPVLDPTGRIVRFIALKQDVTKQRELEDAERFLAAIVTSSRDAIMSATLDGTISSWNHAAGAIFGYTPSEAIGKHLSVVLPPNGAWEVSEIMEQVHRGGEFSNIETIGITKATQPLDLLLSISPVKITNADIVGAAIIARDISEQRRADRALRDNAERFRALFERSHDCLYIHDFDGNFLDANPATLKLLGYDYQELLSLNSAALLSADQMPLVERARAELKARGSLKQPVEYRLKRKTRALVDVQVTASVIPYTAGTRAILGLARDITEQNRAAEALRKSEEKFRQLAENIHEVFWMMNATATEILYVSPAYEEIWERTCEELYRNAMDWLDAIEPEDRERAHSTFLRQMQGEQIESEYRIRTPKGDVKWVRDRAFAIRNDAGEITRVAGVAEEITARKNAESELAHQAQHDHLTGLPNRLSFSDRLETSIIRARDCNRPTAVIYVDLDGFKFINDSLGHEAGDTLLQEVAGRLLRFVRGTDTLARMGGDEFMLVISDLEDDRTALSIAERLRGELAKSFNLAGHELFVTASIGVAMYPRDGLDVSTLRRNADTAMYAAKRSGKDRVQMFSPAMQESFQEHWQIETAMRHALEDGNQFHLAYQPIVEACGRKPIAFEALLRWENPSLGAVSPSKFIAIAEESGLILKLGAWALRQACLECRSWQEDGLRGVRVCVNASPLELASPEYTNHVLRTLEETGLAGNLLEIEVTETVLMRGMKECVRKLSALRSHGVRVSIDDFGTGYSSLAYLPTLPIDTLKIDRSFVTGLGAAAASRSLIEGIIVIAHSMGKRVVVEGVENEGQFEILQQLGCDEIQGYLIGRPSPPPVRLP